MSEDQLLLPGAILARCDRGGADFLRTSEREAHKRGRLGLMNPRKAIYSED